MLAAAGVDPNSVLGPPPSAAAAAVAAAAATAHVAPALSPRGVGMNTNQFNAAAVSDVRVWLYVIVCVVSIGRCGRATAAAARCRQCAERSRCSCR
jgi:hypothetical protein